MDTNSLEAVPPEPLITVEPALSGDRGGDWAHAQHLGPHPVAPPGRCPHRVRVRDLKASARIAFAVAALLVWVSGLVGFAGLLSSVVMAVGSFVEAQPASFIAGLIAVFINAALVSGFLVCVRVWRSLHRPGRLVPVCGTIAALLVFVMGGYMVVAGAPPWLLLVAVPLAPMFVLIYFRAVLYNPGTCGYHPWLAEPVLRLVAT